MTVTHTLALQIDAAQAEAGSKRFTAALNAIRQAVTGLEKSTDGVFAKIVNVAPKVDVSSLKQATTETTRLTNATESSARASTMAQAVIVRTNLAAAAALRTSENAAQRLNLRLHDINPAGIEKVNARLATLRANLAAASSPIEVRQARSTFATGHDGDSRSAIAARTAAFDLQAVAKAEQLATSAATMHAAELESLAMKYNPLKAVSLAYAQSLEEINRAEMAGVITSQVAEQARTRAATSLTAVSAGAQRYGVSAGAASAGAQQLTFQMNDVFTMAAMGASPMQVAVSQMTQIGQAMTMAGGKASAVSTLKSAFLGFLNPTTLAAGAVILLTTALVQLGASFFGADEPTKTFSESLGDASSAISNLSSATETLSGARLGSLATGYGVVNAALQTHLERLQKVATIEAMNANRENIGAASGEMTGGWLTTDLDDIRNKLGTTNDAARQFMFLLNQVKTANTFESQAKAISKAREYLNSLGITLENSGGAAQLLLTQLVKAEDSALKLKAAADGSGSAIATATSQTSAWAGAMAGVHAQIQAIMSSLGGVTGGLISFAANKAELGALAAGKSIQQAAQERQRAELDIKLRQQATTAKSAGPAASWANTGAAALQRSMLEAQIAQDAQLNAARDAARKRDQTSAGSAKGGGGFKPIDDSKVTTDILKRAQALDVQNNALQATIASHYRSEEAAKLYGEAMVAGNGKISEGTRLLLDQIDAQASLNKALQMEAANPLQDYLDSLPTMVSATKQASADVVSSLGDGLTDALMGKFDAKSMVDSMRLALAKQTSGVIMKNIFGKAAAPTDAQGGGTQAGQTIGNAMVTAGNQVANAIRQAITGGGRQASTSVRSGLTSGGASAANATRAAGMAHGQQIRSGGRTMQTAIVSGSQTGAAAMGTAITTASTASAAGAGGGMGGAFLGFIGSMFGFSEGGYSDGSSPHRYTASPAAFRNAPHYKNGTANTDGIPAILHPNEAVIPLSRGRKIPVDMGGQGQGGNTTNAPITINTTVNVDGGAGGNNDTKTAAKLATQISDLVSMKVTEQMATQMQYGGIMNPRGR